MRDMERAMLYRVFPAISQGPLFFIKKSRGHTDSRVHCRWADLILPLLIELKAQIL